MNCPTCAQTLDASQLVCPECGDAPDHGVGLDPLAGALASPWAAPSDWSGPGGPDQPTAPIGGTEPAAGLPTTGFGDPSQYLAATHQPKVRQYLPLSPVTPDGTPWSVAHGAPQPKPKKRLALPILLLALALLVTGGGAAAAGYYLGWFGRGTQPSDLMPATTLAYVQVDLAPSLSQKSQAWAFLRDLPQVKQAVAAGQPDPKRMIWDALVANTGFVAETDYDSEIKPWLGDRIGFGLVGRSEQPVWMVAVQVTDADAATKKLQSWITADDRGLDVTTRDGYAVITASADTDFAIGELDRGTLGGSQTFRSDMGALGDTGVLAGWADLAGLAKQGASGTDTGDAVKGRVAAALRFTTDTLALDGRIFAAGSAATGTSGAGVIGGLPDQTGIAITISGGAAALREIDGPLPTEVSQFGFDKADLEALLGRNLTIAVPTSTMTDPSSVSTTSVPPLGVRITSDDVSRAQDALHRLPFTENSAPQIFDDVDGDVLTAATSQDYLAELLQPPAKLSGYGPFTRAVPDHATASAAAYVNLAPFVTAGADLGEYGDFLKALQGVGAEVVPDGSGGGSWSVRLVRS